MRKQANTGARVGVPSSFFGDVANDRMVPLIFFKLQPEIDAACDELDRTGVREPTRELVERTTDRIYNNVCKKYPELAKYAHEFEKNSTVNPLKEPIFGIQLWGAGVLWGLIAFLFLAEFTRRRPARRFRRF